MSAGFLKVLSPLVFSFYFTSFQASVNGGIPSLIWTSKPVRPHLINLIFF